MSTWEEGITEFIRKLDAIDAALVPAVGAAVLDSIQNGSTVTGAPGQPVGQYGVGYHQGVSGGELKASWQLTFPSPKVALVATNSPYARPNEDGVRHDGRPYTQRSTVGGRHSVALTRVNYQRLVDHVANAGLRPEGFQDNSALGGQ